MTAHAAICTCGDCRPGRSRPWQVKRFAERPIDPRSRVVESSRRDGCDMILHLSCGHSTRRRVRCAPARVVRLECPAAGGLGQKLGR